MATIEGVEKPKEKKKEREDDRRGRKRIGQIAKMLKGTDEEMTKTLVQ